MSIKAFIVGVLSMALTTTGIALKGEGQVIEAYRVSEIQEALSKIPEGSVIFIDVDDTLITPKSKLFRHSSPYRNLIDELKKHAKKYANFDSILSHWRLQRKSMLVAEEWPAFIESLKKKYLVYALTKMNSGSIGDIPSMEKWRYDELIGKGISFTPSYNSISEGVLVSDSSQSSPATFYKGIFITGSLNKGKVLHAYFKSQHPPLIVLIDDRPEYLQDAIEECEKESISFLGILYKGMELIPGVPDPNVAELQKEYLFEKAQWLEDEEAEKLLSAQQKS